jgi:hypothetical protein
MHVRLGTVPATGFDLHLINKTEAKLSRSDPKSR